MKNDAMYWRHKKGTPQEVYPTRNGKVRIIRPAYKTASKPTSKRVYEKTIDGMSAKDFYILKTIKRHID